MKKRAQMELALPLVSQLLVGLFAVAAALHAPTAHAAKTPKWQSNLPAYDAGDPAQPTKGRWLRVMLHLHSVYSHDSCDKKGYKNGLINMKCLNDFRQALCKTHVDVAFITEHKNHLTEINLVDSLNIFPADQPIYQDGSIIGSIQTCPDGHKVRVFPGSENKLMALGQLRHPDPIDNSLDKAYSGASVRVGDGLKATGALLAINHPELLSLEEIRALTPHAIELYNTHGNLMRFTEGNKIKALKPALKLLSFISNPFLKSDLYILSFFKEDDRALKKWSILSLEQQLTGVFGADSHQNIAPIKLWDHDRVDSYRRNLRWFSNLVWVNSQNPTRDEIMSSVQTGKVLTAFEIFGTPDGFEFKADSSNGMANLINGEYSAALPARLTVKAPTVRGWRKPLKAPKITLRILRATANGWVEVSRVVNKPTLQTDVTEAGVYRAEARIHPDHLRPYLRTAHHLIKNYPWVYSNTLRVGQ